MSQDFKFPVLIFIVASAIPACLGQTGIVLAPLRVLDEIPVPSIQIGGMGWRAVPGNGEFYVQTDRGKYLAVDLRGRTHSALDVDKVTATTDFDPKDLLVADMSPAPRGGAIAPVLWQSKEKLLQSGILHFSEDGGYDGLTRLDAKFRPTHVAEFSSAGDYLVTGYDEYSRVQVSLFDRHGKMLIAHVLPDGKADESPRKTEPGGHAEMAAAKESGLMQVVSADDDAIYLFDPYKGRKVIRIEPSGESSEIALSKPNLKDGEATMPVALLVTHGNLYLYEAVLSKEQTQQEAMELNRFVLSVYDRYNGTLDASYTVDDSIGGFPVALAPREFYFLKEKEAPGGAWSFSLARAGW